MPTPCLRHRLQARLAGVGLVLLAAACDLTQIDDDTQTGVTGSGVEQTEPAAGGG